MKPEKKDKESVIIIEEVIELTDDDDDNDKNDVIIQDAVEITPKYLKWKMPQRISHFCAKLKQPEGRSKSSSSRKESTSSDKRTSSIPQAVNNKITQNVPIRHEKSKDSTKLKEKSNLPTSHSTVQKSLNPKEKKSEIKSNEMIIDKNQKILDKKETRDHDQCLPTLKTLHHSNGVQNENKKKSDLNEDIRLQNVRESQSSSSKSDSNEQPSSSNLTIIRDELKKKKVEEKTLEINSFKQFSSIVSDLFDSCETPNSSDQTSEKTSTTIGNEVLSSSIENVTKEIVDTLKCNSKPSSSKEISESSSDINKENSTKKVTKDIPNELARTSKSQPKIHKNDSPSKSTGRQNSIKKFFKPAPIEPKKSFDTSDNSKTELEDNFVETLAKDVVQSIINDQNSENSNSSFSTINESKKSTDDQVEMPQKEDNILVKIKQEPVDPTDFVLNRQMSIDSFSNDSGINSSIEASSSKRKNSYLESNSSPPKKIKKKIKIEPKYDSDAETDSETHTDDDDDAVMDEILQFTLNFDPSEKIIKEIKSENFNEESTMNDTQNINESEESLSQNLIPYMPNTILPPLKEEDSP